MSTLYSASQSFRITETTLPIISVSGETVIGSKLSLCGNNHMPLWS